MELIKEKPEIVLWLEALGQAQHETNINLGEGVEAYTVFLLSRFKSRLGLVHKVLATDYMTGLLSRGRVQTIRLQEVGDSCLVLSGFFPKRARRLNVDTDYFENIGIGAYGTLHDLGFLKDNPYGALAENFRDITTVLRVMSTQKNPRLINTNMHYVHKDESTIVH